jgi:hypothetical protein
MPDETRSSASGSTAQVFAWAAGIYFVPFFLVLFDELILKTNWSHYLPRGAQDIFETVYYPFILLVRAFLH